MKFTYRLSFIYPRYNGILLKSDGAVDRLLVGTGRTGNASYRGIMLQRVIINKSIIATISVYVLFFLHFF